MDRTHATVYVPWVKEMTEDMMEERPEQSSRGRKMVKTFLEGVSLQEASVLIG
jgi:hypothetical protein